MNNTPCGCRLKCFEAVGDEHRIKLFDSFWKLASFDVQNTYLTGCVSISEVHRRYSPRGESSRRQFSREYSVRNATMCSIPVCKTAFLRIHGVSNGRLSRALKAVQGGTPHQDQRGKHPPANKTPDDVVKSVTDHIESFPKYKSHYSRHDNPHREYLSPELTLTKMYALYEEYCDEKGIIKIASEWVYRKEFNKSYNLHFGR